MSLAASMPDRQGSSVYRGGPETAASSPFRQALSVTPW